MPLPFFHAASAPVTFTSPLRSGHVTYAMRRFELESYLKYMEQYEIPEVLAVPPMVIAIIMSPLSKKYSLRKTFNATFGAAPMDKDTQRRFLSLMAPDAKCSQVWGLTESTCVTTHFQWPEKDDTGSVGRFVPNMEAKYVFLQVLVLLTNMSKAGQ